MDSRVRAASMSIVVEANDVLFAFETCGACGAGFATTIDGLHFSGTIDPTSTYCLTLGYGAGLDPGGTITWSINGTSLSGTITGNVCTGPALISLTKQ
jgi:hypothetical protein